MTTLPERLLSEASFWSDWPKDGGDIYVRPDGAADMAALLREAATALQGSGGEVVAWALRDEADGTYWQFFTDKDAGAKRAAIHGDTLVPLYLASPAQPRGDYKPGDRVLWTDSSGMYASAVGVVRERSNPAPVRYWIDFPDGSVASCALAHELTTPPTQQEARAVGDAWTKEAPTESGWYWHDDRDAMRLHCVFTRPGHAYLCTEGEPYGHGQKRNFQAVQKMGGVWSGPVNPPTRAALHPGAKP